MTLMKVFVTSLLWKIYEIIFFFFTFFLFCISFLTRTSRYDLVNIERLHPHGSTKRTVGIDGAFCIQQ